MDVERRRVLEAAAYSVAALALPAESWWQQMASHRRPASGRGLAAAGLSDVEAVRDMTALFSRVDQRRGGGHARAAVIRYLSVDVATYLRSNFTHENVRRQMFAAASELAYLVGWMAFDDLKHAHAQRYFLVALKLAAEADDPALAGHILRAMAHQAIDLKHHREALDLSAASIRSDRYSQASPREQSLVSVIHARSLAVNGDRAAATAELLRAEDALASAAEVEAEPGRIFFFGEASLSHETACALRDSGDLDGAAQQFKRSIRTRKATKFARTHAVTPGYMGAVQMRRGEVEQACQSWAAALDAMDGVRSGRTRQVVVGVRQDLAPLQRRAGPEITELLRRTNTHLAAAT